MSQPFAFPPPPPPPPKPQQSNDTYQQPNTRGGFRGRGGSQRGHQSGRGRGQYPPRGRGSYGARGNHMNYARGGYLPHTTNLSAPSASSQPQQGYDNSSMSQAQKRNHATAFNDRPNSATRDHRPAAPPAVPSFGIDFASLLPTKPEFQKPSPKGPPKKPNLLGLTPVAKDDDDEEDDEEEERKLAGKIQSDSALQFEYNGQTATLNTPEEIAAWIAERRKKWPTEQKREVAQRDAAERKKRWEVDRAARMEASKATAKARQEQRQNQKVEREKSQIRQKLLREQIQKAKAAPAIDEILTAAQTKAEKLRRKSEKIALQLKMAEAVLDKDKGNAHAEAITEPDLDTLLTQVDAIASTQQLQPNSINKSDSTSNTSPTSSPDPTTTINDETSTSGSSSPSDSDSDSPPEPTTTKRTAPDRVLAPARKAPPGAPTDNRPLCKNMAQYGRCKFGSKCRFKHERPGKKEESTSGNRRKGLYQIMVEREREEERKRALRVIMALGEAGVLDEVAHEKEAEAEAEAGVSAGL